MACHFGRLPIQCSDTIPNFHMELHSDSYQNSSPGQTEYCIYLLKKIYLKKISHPSTNWREILKTSRVLYISIRFFPTSWSSNTFKFPKFEILPTFFKKNSVFDGHYGGKSRHNYASLHFFTDKSSVTRMEKKSSEVWKVIFASWNASINRQ